MKPRYDRLSADYVDLHLHTCYSDGTDTPAMVVKRAAGMGFTAIAVTDHDTVAGVAEAAAGAGQSGLEFLAGVEISALLGGVEVHVVGLGIDTDEPELCAALDYLRDKRVQRAAKIIDRLDKLGIHIDRQRLEARVGSATTGRIHIAQELDAMGAVGDVQAAFNKYIGAGRPCFVPKTGFACERAVELVHGAGGLAFIAHPAISTAVEKRLPELLRLPFDGIEAYHTKHSPARTGQFIQLAQSRGTLVSGGSDCHGAAKNKTPEMGRVRVPYRYYQQIKDTLTSRQNTAP